MAGSNYFIRVYAVTGYGQGPYSYLQKTVPPLNLRVNSAYSYMSGARYGLQVYVYWYRPYGYPYLYSGPVVSLHFQGNLHSFVFVFYLFATQINDYKNKKIQKWRNKWRGALKQTNYLNDNYDE